MDNSLSLPVVPKGQDTKTEKSGVDKPQEKPNEKLADKVVENLHKEKDVAKLAMPKTKNLGGDGTFKGLDKEIDKGMARTIDVLVDKGLSKFGFKNSLEKKRDQENQNQIKVKKELLEVQLNKLDQQRKGRAREQKNEIRLAILQNIDEKRGRRRQTKTTFPGAS